MALPTPVNGQITDAVNEANTKVLGDAPAIAMGELMMATSQALANAAHNAVESQQQGHILSQATATQCVSTLLSLDTVATAQAVKAETEPLPPTAMAAAAALTGSQTQVPAVADAGSVAAANAVPDAAMAQLEQAINFVDKLVFDDAIAWANAVREVMAAFTGALEGLQALNTQTNLAVLKQAALAAALTRMIALPEELEKYQKIIEVIKAV